MYDVIETMDHSIIHHGKNSNRIYVMSLNYQDIPDIMDQLDVLASTNGYTKIIVKVPIEYIKRLEDYGYKKEAMIRKLYNGEKDGYFLCKYLDHERETDPFANACTKIIESAMRKEEDSCNVEIKDCFLCRQATKGDVADMVAVYQSVFKSYPFPIFDEAYLLKTMEENLIYFGIWHNKKLIALSSIELDEKNSNAEMTDFAVMKEYRGRGFARYLLNQMEEKLMSLNVKTAFTIARAQSEGMNITFKKNGYTYAGTLINNTDIAGHIESMNVWYKQV
ncbi:MAG: putative beta-lysine N-acetyltransferase [Velocimicrobium sp.]